MINKHLWNVILGKQKAKKLPSEKTRNSKAGKNSDKCQ